MSVFIPIGFMIFDFVTGMIGAIKNKKFNSSVMRTGGFNKLGSLCAIILGLGIDYAQQFIDLGYVIPVSLAINSYISLMEIGSSLENIGKINPKLLSSKIRDIFIKLKDGDTK